MPVIDIVDKDNKKVGEAELTPSMFGEPANEAVIYQVARAQLAARRRGTHKTKSRSEAAGSGAKPWRQKGTGRARAGTRTSPLWSQSTIFGPVPRSYRQAVPRKMRRKAMRAVLSERVRQGGVRVVSDYDLTTPKTKEAVALLNRLNLEGCVLAVVTGEERNFRLATRNLPGVRTVRPVNVDLLAVLDSEILLFSEESLQQFGECHGAESV